MNYQEPLTPRECEVLALLAQGLTNKEIADALFISQHTVHQHLIHIYDKLGVSSRVLAALKAEEFIAQTKRQNGVKAAAPSRSHRPREDCRKLS